ncbi:MAG: hypothetical protein ABIK37_01165 [candidate division WOR-3 bacterium]
MSRTVAVALVIAGIAGTAFAADYNCAGRAGGFLVSGQGSVNFYLKSGEPEDTPTEGFRINLVPRALYFLIDGLGAGLDLGLDYYTNDYKSTDLAIGPRVAYYFMLPNRRYSRGGLARYTGGEFWLMPFAGATVQYLNQTMSYSGGSMTSSGFRARAGVGISPLIGSHGTMPVELGFQHQSLKYGSSTTTSNQIYLEAGFGAFLWKK